jgi:hypothetical protein
MILAAFGFISPLTGAVLQEIIGMVLYKYIYYIAK